jgi:hypothetical protein
MLDLDKDYHHEGQEAAYVLGRLRPQLNKLREKAIANLVLHHRNETLTEGLMRSGIAMLAVLDELPRELDRLIRLGQQDIEEARRG